MNPACVSLGELRVEVQGPLGAHGWSPSGSRKASLKRNDAFLENSGFEGMNEVTVEERGLC